MKPTSPSDIKTWEDRLAERFLEPHYGMTVAMKEEIDELRTALIGATRKHHISADEIIRVASESGFQILRHSEWCHQAMKFAHTETIVEGDVADLVCFVRLIETLHQIGE